jgi:hypothetical protein
MQELSVCDILGDSIENYIIKSPSPASSLSGFPYKNISPLLEKYTDQFTFVFAKGEILCNEIMKLITPDKIVYNLDMFDCPKIRELELCDNSMCIIHKNYSYQKPNCAKYYASAISEWCRKNYDCINLLNAGARLCTFKGLACKEIKPVLLARTGFVSVPNAFKTIKCIYCNSAVEQIDNSDDVLEKHRMSNANCLLFNYKHVRWGYSLFQ